MCSKGKSEGKDAKSSNPKSEPQTPLIKFCGPFPPFCVPSLPTGDPLGGLCDFAPPPRPCGNYIMLNAPVGKTDRVVVHTTDVHHSKGAKKGPKESGDHQDKSDSKKKKRKRASSRELRAGILYRGCDCERLNGLQDDCRRTGCHGTPECMMRPPKCGPSEFSNAKHLVRLADANRARKKLE